MFNHKTLLDQNGGMIIHHVLRKLSKWGPQKDKEMNKLQQAQSLSTFFFGELV